MIISGGENVYPAEIEDVLLSHPASPTSRSWRCARSSGASRHWRWSCAQIPTSTRLPYWPTAAEGWPGFKEPKRAVFVDVDPAGSPAERQSNAYCANSFRSSPPNSQTHSAFETTPDGRGCGLGRPHTPRNT